MPTVNLPAVTLSPEEEATYSDELKALIARSPYLKELIDKIPDAKQLKIQVDRKRKELLSKVLAQIESDINTITNRGEATLTLTKEFFINNGLDTDSSMYAEICAVLNHHNYETTTDVNTSDLIVSW